MRHISTESRVGDGSHYTIPLDLLGSIQFMPAGNSAGVKMTNPLDVLSDGLNQIPFHDLHVVDVIEEFHIRRIDLLDHAYPPRGVVTHVIVMVSLAVEQFHADGHAMIFRNLLDSIQAGDGVLSPLFIGEAGAIS